MARLTATVVLPTPPLPEPTATIFETPGKATVTAWRENEPLITPEEASFPRDFFGFGMLRPIADVGFRRQGLLRILQEHVEPNSVGLSSGVTSAPTMRAMTACS